MTPKHFKKAILTVEAGVFLRGYFWKLYKSFYHYFNKLPSQSTAIPVEG
jgi:hypothetical protein